MYEPEAIKTSTCPVSALQILGKPFTHSSVTYKNNFSDRNDARNLVPNKNSVMCVTGAPILFVAARSTDIFF